MSAGKGSSPRPYGQGKFEQGHERIWGKKNKEPKKNKRVIHINAHSIKRNIHLPEDKQEPIFTCKTHYKGDRHNVYAHEMEILGDCKLVYKPKNPLPCGARCYIEITDPETVLLLDGEDIFKRLEKEEEND